MLSQTATGIFQPEWLVNQLICSAFSVMFCIHAFKSYTIQEWMHIIFLYSQKRGLATTDLEESLGSLGPALLTATMRNSYSCPSWTLVTFPAVLQ
jgi:hypothetical protein